MISREFIYKEDEHGNVGWIPEWLPNATSGDGRTVAHDVLEHMPNSTNRNSSEDELVAMGAVYYIRGETGLLYSPYRDITETIASDIYFILSDSANNGERIRSPGFKYKLSDYSVDDTFKQATREGIKSFKENYEDDIDILDENTYTYILNWMRIGYRQAINRYKNTDQGTIGYIFNQIQREVDKCKYINEYDKMRVTVNVKKANVKVTILNTNEYGEYN